MHTSRLLSLWVGTLPFVLVGCFTGARRLLTVPLTTFVAWALFCTEEARASVRPARRGRPPWPLRARAPARRIDTAAITAAARPRSDPSSHRPARVQGDGLALAALLDTWPIWRGVLGVGDVSLYDSRLLHAGGANASERRRAGGGVVV